MYNVWQDYGSDEYGWSSTIVAAFNSKEAADAYASEHGGRVIYDASCAGYPEFTS